MNQTKPKQTKPKQHEKSAQTKAQIRDTAIELFDRKSIDRTTIQDICKAAGISVGAFYYYYKSKEDILLQESAGADDEFCRCIRNEGGERDVVRFIMGFFGYYGYINEQLGNAMQVRLHLDQSVRVKCKGRREMYRLLDEYVERAQEEGRMKAVCTPEETTDYMFMVARGVIFDWCTSQGFSADMSLKDAMKKAFQPVLAYFV